MTREAPKSPPFVQHFLAACEQYEQLCFKHPTAAGLLIFFVRHMNKTNSLCVSYRTMEELTGVSRSSLSKGVKILRDNNWIEVITVGNVPTYTVNSRAFWKNSEGARQYASFTATILASSGEQAVKVKKAPNLMAMPTVVQAAHEGPSPFEQEKAE